MNSQSTKILKLASVTKKVTLALLGLFLVVFLLVHMGINLTMLMKDNGATFRMCAHFMGTNPLVKLFEYVLMGTFLLHICLALVLAFENRKARPVRYAVSSKSKVSPFSNWMVYSGVLLIAFLLLHFVHFYFVKLDLVESKYMINLQEVSEYMEQHPDALQLNQEKIRSLIENADPAVLNSQKVIGDLSKADMTEAFGENFKIYEPDFYVIAKQLFKNIWAVIVYVVLIIVVGTHVGHGFSSAFQSLGLNHSKYTPFVKCLSYALAAVITIGFCIIPVMMFLA